MFIDSHAHLNDGQLLKDVEAVMERCREYGVDKVVCSSDSYESSLQAVNLAKKYNNIYATVGVHPHNAKDYSETIEQNLKKLICDKVVAYGEIGLDYHYDFSPRDLQRKVFERQLLIADSFSLPVVIHMRDATADTCSILERNKDLLKHGGLLHCFNGSVETLKRMLKLGLKISFGGAITFKNSKFEDIIVAAGLDNILLETDCPYMTPVPYRGERNEPKYISLVAEKLAEVLEISVEEVGMQTSENAKKLFKLK